MSAATVPLPTAVGPASTISRAPSRSRPVSWFHPSPVGTPASISSVETRSLGEFTLERRDLVGPEAAHPACFGDTGSLHDLLRAHLADAGDALQQGADPHLADHLVGPAFMQHLRRGR